MTIVRDALSLCLGDRKKMQKEDFQNLSLHHKCGRSNGYGTLYFQTTDGEDNRLEPGRWGSSCSWSANTVVSAAFGGTCVNSALLDAAQTGHWPGNHSMMCSQKRKEQFFLHFLKLFYYSYVHTMLGSFLPPAPNPSLTTHSAQPLNTRQKLFCPYH
jgi:hypothetical protein